MYAERIDFYTMLAFAETMEVIQCLKNYGNGLSV